MTMTHEEFLTWLRSHQACPSAIEFVLQGQHTPESAWAECNVGHWMLWGCEKAGVPFSTLAPVVYRAVNRAMDYAADALRDAGLKEDAEKLRAIPAVVDESTAAAAEAAAWAEAAAAWAEAAAEARAEAAAEAARAAAEWAATSATSAASAWAEEEAAAAAENLQCAADCRELLTCPKLEE
jgi:hypothetical protein